MDKQEGFYSDGNLSRLWHFICNDVMSVSGASVLSSAERRTQAA